MKTISQIAELTGISVRTLQYYDEINLLAPSALTEAGYRLYDETTLEKIHQILFFKELDFKLNDIREILVNPNFDKIEAYKQQKKLICLKRDRLDRLITLLEKLEKGEPCMGFKEFDLTNYITALEEFKKNHMDDVIKHWGSLDNFILFIQKVKDDETNVARLAIKEYGSIEKYTKSMKYNIEHFSEIMEQQLTPTENMILQKYHNIRLKLTSDMEKNITSDEIQTIVHELVTFTQEEALSSKPGKGYWDMVIESYSNDICKAVTDTKYGTGAASYISKALQYYFTNNSTK
ncbi:MerR family transcriptional regulator [Anaerosporobacter sp.]